MINSLYPPFRKWTEKGTLWVYSDPHFSDPDCIEMRKNYIGDDEQVARINSKVGKNDTIIFLGDIGNEEMIRRIRGYKVLIMGNHDKGASKYERRIEKWYFNTMNYDKDNAYSSACKRYPNWNIRLYHHHDASQYPYEWWVAECDNCLFDEVYEGPLFIAEKLVLSHESIVLPYAFNVHGHEHRYIARPRELNVCAEYIDYYPVNLTREIKNGLVSEVESLHRMVIDNATERKNRKKPKREKFQSINVGDTVWVYDFMWGIIPCEVDSLYHCRCGKDGGCSFEMVFSEDDIDLFVFLSQEEAEIEWRKKKE